MAAITEQDFNTIIDTLNRDQQITQALLKLLAKETDSLRQRAFKALPDISNEKTQLINKIEENSKHRQSLLHKITNNEHPAEQLKQVVTRCNPQQAQKIRSLNASLEKTLTECRNKNAVNGQVIAVSLKNNQQLLNILTGQAHDDKLYDASGRVSSNNSGANYQKV